MHLSPCLAHTGFLPGPHFENPCHGDWAELGRRELELSEQILSGVQARAKAMNIVILMVLLIINMHMHLQAKLIALVIGSNSQEY